MRLLEKISTAFRWITGTLIIALITACGGGGGGSAAVPATAISSAKAITAFSFSSPIATGTVNEAAKTISVIVPFGTPVTALVATFVITGASVKIGATVQVSGTTPNTFTTSQVYTVTAADASTVAYTVTVAVASGSAKAISAFSLSGATGIISEAGKTIAVTVPYGTDLTALVATFTTTGASVKIGATTQTSGSTPNNFTASVAYIVTAADTTMATYTVTATAATATAKALTGYSLAGVAGVINEAGKTISVTLPSGTAVTALIATFTTSGASVKIGGTVQASATTANNFTSPVAYIVSDANALTATYTVNVTLAPANSKTLTAFSISGVTATINEAAKTVSVTLPSGTVVSSLIATFTGTGTSVNIGSTPQISGATANNFTNPVVYKVVAADASIASYTVTVTVSGAGPAPLALGLAGNYAIFADTGISTIPSSVITGDIGVGPGVTSTAITGFTLNLPAASPFSTSTQVSGKVYAHDYAVPTPADVTTASVDLGFAYDDAATRLNPNFTNFGAGELGVQTLAPGLYKWTGNVTLNTGDVTINGAATDVWIFQISGTLDLAANRQVLLTGGATPANVFWQVAGAVTVGANAKIQGVVLSKTAITLGNLATVNGKLLAQTAVNLDQNTIAP
jgi:hypothetical protein